jgi:hypothetical protein
MKHIWTKNGVEIPHSEVSSGYEAYCRTLEPFQRGEALAARKAVLEVEGDGVTILTNDDPNKKIHDMYFAWYMDANGIGYRSEP